MKGTKQALGAALIAALLMTGCAPGDNGGGGGGGTTGTYGDDTTPGGTGGTGGGGGGTTGDTGTGGMMTSPSPMTSPDTNDTTTGTP